ncbi:RNA polymerase sigma factor [Sphingobacterium haloxyli]|uniref:RNA polymerase subunit sigma-70 n=1 Tax=Sphingobacterium haloxyli TaxID=2100533 RepID=A0A2S9J6W2_9SPHI|nr:RNA polymerase sigma factor [Sphingobacterium haloxyli]PRD48536.1 RNA polymerase subunit sigma-70 [Sphingobacterium haloxyli]
MEPKERAFLTQIEAHKGILHKVGRIYVDDIEDRKDLHQEIIIQLWKSYDKFQGQSAFSSWMYRVAVNTAISYFKKEKRHGNTIAIDTVAEPESEPYDPKADEQLELFYRAVQHLSPVEKAIILYFMEGLSHREIGLQLGITEGNARVKLNRTKEKLQTITKKYNDEL